MPGANFRYGAVTVHHLISIQKPLEKYICTCIVYIRGLVPLACVAFFVYVNQMYNVWTVKPILLGVSIDKGKSSSDSQKLP